MGDWFQFGVAAATVYIAFMQKVNARRARAAALVAARERAQQGLTLEKVHKLTNSAMLAQKRALMLTTRRLASLTNEPRDQSAAELARIDYENHLATQMGLDKGGGI